MIGPFKGEYRFLSNFWWCSVEFEGLMYRSVEAAYQAAKTPNGFARERFTRLSPRDARVLGRQVTLRDDWEQVRLRVMETCLRGKFRDPILAQKLLSTGDEELVEVNWWHDTFWGVCDGVGENHLGKLLMKIRKEL